MNPWKFLLYEFSINDRNTLTFSQFKAIVKILEGYNAANQKGKLEELKALFAEEGSIDKRGKVNIIDNDAEKNRGEDLEWNLSKLWSCYAYYVLKCEGYCFTDGKYATQKLYYKGYHTHNVGLCMNLIIDNSDGSLVSKDFLKMSYERFGFGVASRAERSLELASKHFELYIENIGKDMRMMLDSKKHGSSGRIIQPEEYDNLGIMYEAANNCMDILQLKISRAKLGGKKALADKEYITKEIGEIFKTIDQIVGMLQKRNCIQMAIHLVLRLEEFLDYDNQFTNTKPKPTQLSTFSLAMLRSSEVRAHYLANFVKGFSQKLEGQATAEDTSGSLEEKQDKVTNEVVNAMLLGCANDQNIEQMCTVIRLWPDLVDIKSLFHVLVLVLKQFYRTSTGGFDHSGVKNSGYIDSKDIYGLIDRYTGIGLLNTDSIAEASSSNIQNEYMHNERQSFSEQNQHVSHGIPENKVDDSDLIFLINFLELKFFADKDILLQRQYLLKSNQFILSKLIDLLLNVVGFDLGTVVRFYKQNFIESAAILNIFVKHLVSTHGIHYAFQFVKICSFNFAQEKNYFVGTDEMCQLPASHPDSLNSRSTLDSKRNAAAFDEHDSILLSELYCPPVNPDHITRTILLRNLASSANPKDARLYSKIASFFTEKLFPLPLN
ncbi:hypothetical protein AX774_g7197 [Zancudomyces culisetae]|uniref:Uncharacterized protein n=1 Tax=Zancudomyces culisetae TaxID=1213189 RepID=A0A1R1PEF5_ZANCU|nr:hypothetical protein AX774_g7197 [Zancudomyces culisetae]|eukprot:OMH79385.1 hypothetical protein AX774_g7197 [Zancudomyces culisetae]